MIPLLVFESSIRRWCTEELNWKQNDDHSTNLVCRNMKDRQSMSQVVMDGVVIVRVIAVKITFFA